MVTERPEPLDPQRTLGVERERMPRHVAIIMDGNGRWAQNQGQPRMMGHQAGARTVDRISTVAARLGLEQLTLYAFSTENWKRGKQEIDFLMELYAAFLESRRRTMKISGIRFRQIGRRSRIPAEVLRRCEAIEAESASNPGMTLCIAVDYGAREEITAGVRTLCKRVRDGRLDPDAVDEKAVADSLYTAGMIDPDLMIRTAGEMRLSNYLLWQLSYAELYVTDVMWPDFMEEDFYAALREYARRQRRFGAETADIGFGVGDDQ